MTGVQTCALPIYEWLEAISQSISRVVQSLRNLPPRVQTAIADAAMPENEAAGRLLLDEVELAIHHAERVLIRVRRGQEILPGGVDASQAKYLTKSRGRKIGILAGGHLARVEDAAAGGALRAARGEVPLSEGVLMVAPPEWPERAADATIDALRQAGVKLALVTNGSSAMERAKIERFDLAHRFDHIQIEGEFGQGKPELAVYRHALARLGCAACDAWMVGDNYEWEVVAPQRLGMCGIWYDPFDFGVPSTATARPARVIKRLAELVE